MYTRFSKVFYFLSVGLFLFVFLYIYSAASEFVSYKVDEEGIPLKQLTRNSFFYITLAVFLVFNVLMVIPAKLIELQYSLRLKRLFPKTDPFRDKMLAWIFSFTGILNVSAVMVILYIHSISNQNEISSSEFSFFFYMVPVLWLIWMVGLFYILGKKIKEMKGERLSN
ncbi:MAG: DNA topoisomerase IV [Cyclobacteriaceae bacterium]